MSRHEVRATVNGVERTETVEARLLLVHLLRDRLRLTGTKVGCDTTSCGACAVMVDDRVVKSCTVFAVQVDGSTIRTVEGLSDGEALDPLQRAFRDEHGLQCGYCTSGMLLAARGLLDRNPHPTDEEIRLGISGNLCRCTGYANIVAAIRRAAAEA